MLGVRPVGDGDSSVSVNVKNRLLILRNHL